MLKYAPQADIVMALNNTNNAKKLIAYKYSIYYKKETPKLYSGSGVYYGLTLIIIFTLLGGEMPVTVTSAELLSVELVIPSKVRVATTL